MSEQPSYRRFVPLAVLAGAMVVAYVLGLNHYLSFEAIAGNSAALKAYVAQHLVLAILLYCTIYVAVVALSLPGAGLLSILGGFVFGWLVSGTVTILAATAGAVIVFQVVKTSLGCYLAERAGPLVKKLSHGFERDAFNYLLFLRLVPAVPFCAVNVVAGLARVRLKVFTLSTLIGILPGSYAFAWLGQGLDSAIESQRAAQAATCASALSKDACPIEFSISTLVTKELLIAFALLAVLALIPIAVKRYKGVA